jgi:hypothetical protein
LRSSRSLSSPAALALLVALLPIAAHGATYRCTDAKGKTTLQDVPCPALGETGAAGPTTSRLGVPMQGTPAAAAVLPPPNTGDYSSARGAWRGPAQFHLVAGGQRDLQAHRIAPLVIDLAADGKVTGVVSEAGCKISGLTTQFIMPTMANIDVTLTGCTDTRFNTRMSGTLSAHKSAKETTLRLASIGYTRSMKLQQLTLDAVLRR